NGKTALTATIVEGVGPSVDVRTLTAADFGSFQPKHIQRAFIPSSSEFLVLVIQDCDFLIFGPDRNALRSQMLDCLDTFLRNPTNIFLGTTNMVECPEEYIRPGRLGRPILVLPPEEEARREMIIDKLGDERAEEVRSVLIWTRGLSFASIALLLKRAPPGSEISYIRQEVQKLQTPRTDLRSLTYFT
ncbi:MAG: hypothetical protein ACKVOH_03155, partial [Chlamydiales bacterium]